MPSSEFDISEINGGILAASYGFRSWPDYSRGQLLRMIQRGLGNGIADEIKASTFAGNRGPYPAGGLKILKTEVRKLELDQKEDKLLLEINWELIDQNKNSTLDGSCLTNARLDSSLDGSWVFALEQAASNITNTMFTRKNSSETICRKRSL